MSKKHQPKYEKRFDLKAARKESIERCKETGRKFVYIAFQKEIGFYSILMPNRFEVWVCYESGRLEPITNTPHSSRFHAKRIERKFWKYNI